MCKQPIIHIEKCGKYEYTVSNLNRKKVNGKVVLTA